MGRVAFVDISSSFQKHTYYLNVANMNCRYEWTMAPFRVIGEIRICASSQQEFYHFGMAACASYGKRGASQFIKNINIRANSHKRNNTSHVPFQRCMHQGRPAFSIHTIFLGPG